VIIVLLLGIILYMCI